MKEIVLITGGRGSLAGKLNVLLSKNYEVRFLTTKKEPDFKNHFYWNINESYVSKNALTGIKHIIHLSGFNISNRWTKKNKILMYQSRVDASKLLLKKCEELQIKPKTFITASAIGYYNNKKNIQTETSIPGKDWISNLCIDWEQAAENFLKLGSRVIKLRFPLILDKDSGILKRILLGFKLNTGLIFGNGTQSFPWIDIKDASRFIHFAIEDEKITGVYNCLCSDNSSFSDFIQEIKNTKYKHAFIIYIPKKLIEIIFGEQTRIILSDTRVSNSKIRQTGFKFDTNSISEIFS